MKKNYTIILLIFAVVLSLFALLTKNLSAQSVKFNGVIPFSTPGGFLGFFDQNNGNVYLYDQDLRDCVLTAHIDRLGAPATSR